MRYAHRRISSPHGATQAPPTELFQYSVFYVPPSRRGTLVRTGWPGDRAVAL